MNRIMFVLLIWLVFMGGLTLYMRWRDSRSRQKGPPWRIALAEGRYTAEVTPSFAPEPDAFALRDESDDAGAALAVFLGGREILRRDGGVEAGAVIRLDDLRPAAGADEIRVTANPPDGEYVSRHFVQVRVLLDGAVVAEDTFWSDGGLPVIGILRFETAPAKEDDHAR